MKNISRILNKIIGFIIYIIGMLLMFGILSVEELGDSTALILIALGSLMIEVYNKKV